MRITIVVIYHSNHHVAYSAKLPFFAGDETYVYLRLLPFFSNCGVIFIHFMHVWHMKMPASGVLPQYLAIDRGLVTAEFFLRFHLLASFFRGIVA